MKVLLIQSPLGNASKVTPAFPLGLAYLYGALKDAEVTVVDPNTEEQPLGKIEKAIASTEPDVIGVSLRNIDTAISSDVYSYFPLFTKLLETISRNRSGAKIVVGGTGFSIFPEEIMNRFLEIDYGLFLEGEDTFSNLLKDLEHPERVPGVYYRRGKEVHFTGRAPLVDFEALEAPPRSLAGLDIDCYRKIPHSFGVQTKRGCAFRCAYCTYPYLQGSSNRLRSPKAVVDEVENLVDNFGVESFFFADTIFNYPFDHARKICGELKKRRVNAKWSGWFKENYVNREFIQEALDAGCVCFEFSPDGTSQEALDALQKDITIQDIKRTAELISEFKDAKVNYNFLRNSPGETLKGITRFHTLLPWIVAKNRRQIGFIGFNSIRIYPHTEIYRTALSRGYITGNQDLIKPTFYDPFPLNAAYFPARCTNYFYLRTRNLSSILNRFR